MDELITRSRKNTNLGASAIQPGPHKNNTTMKHNEYTIKRLKHELLELDTRILGNMHLAADDQRAAIEHRSYGRLEMGLEYHESAAGRMALVNTLLAKKEQVISMLDFMENSLDSYE